MSGKRRGLCELRAAIAYFYFGIYDRTPQNTKTTATKLLRLFFLCNILLAEQAVEYRTAAGALIRVRHVVLVRGRECKFDARALRGF